MKNDDYKLFYDFFESLYFGAFIFDSEGKYLYVNDAYCKMTGKSKSIFNGLSASELKKLSRISHSVYEEVQKSKTTASVMIHVTDPTITEDYDILATGTPCFDSDDNIKYIFYIEERMHDLNMRIQEGLHHHKETVIVKGENDLKFIAQSPQMVNILHILNAASSTDAPILISGESGTGKEVLANHIHSISNRSDKPFIVINCAAIPETLIESELFGYEKGAFSGAATSGKIGLIEAADGGTLFLDEINSMPYSVQAKFLRALENKEIIRIGSTTKKKVDFRLICSSNEDMYNLVKKKLFRSDLFYRIDVISITIPPLRERREDIYPLILHFMDIFCKHYGITKSLSTEVIDWCLNYDWPGNTRELKNTIEKMLIISPDDEIEIQRMPQKDTAAYAPSPESEPKFETGQTPVVQVKPLQQKRMPTLKEYLDSCEKHYLEEALERYKRPATMAKVLGLNISNVYRKLQKHGIKIKGV